MVPKPTTHLLEQLRALMRTSLPEPLQAYMVPSGDPHGSQFVSQSDKFPQFIAGFTGSYGSILVTEKQALLWTAGIYYIQAAQQVDSNWTLMKMGLPSTPSQTTWLNENLPKGSRIGLSPFLTSHSNWTRLETNLAKAGNRLVPVYENLIKPLWTDRPARSQDPVCPFALKYTGKTVAEKLEAVREKMVEKRVQVLVLTALADVAWLLNLRGSDVDYNPVFFSYLVVHQETFTLFLNSEGNRKGVEQHLTEEACENFEIKPYKEILDYVKTLEGHVWFSKSANYALTSSIPRECRHFETTPVAMLKIVKNSVELRGMRNAHLKDGVALCCYFSWLEKNIGSGVTEISGAEKLDEFRLLQPDYLGRSFGTISAVGAHAAMPHYEPKEDTDVPITADSIYLCDSGGQYKDGTTDVTRTFHFGTPTDHEKECYTRVLKGQLKLARLVFPAHTTGGDIDAFARQYLWSFGSNYRHGTGHGVGHFLHVHEGPISIGPGNRVGLEVGMVVSNEPGHYEEGNFGIRIEDMVEVVETQTKYSSKGYLTFNTITFCPKQTKLILKELLTDEEVRYLDGYHQQCRDLLGPRLEEQGHLEAVEWLCKETEPLSK